MAVLRATNLEFVTSHAAAQSAIAVWSALHHPWLVADERAGKLF
jgi:hypothetical protein